MKVKEFMKTNVISVNSHASIFEALKLLKDHSIRRMPVMDDGHLVGIVTRAAIKAASPSQATSLSIYELNYLLSKMTVADVMHKNPITVSPETAMEEAAYIMHKKRIGGLPVVKDGKVEGFISSNDLFEQMSHLMGLDEPACRVTLELNQADWHQVINQCLDVMDADHDVLKMLSIVDQAGSDKQIILLRFKACRNVNQFVEAVQAKGLKVLSVVENVKMMD